MPALAPAAATTTTTLNGRPLSSSQRRSDEVGVCECVCVWLCCRGDWPISACSPVATCYLLLCFPNVALLFLLLTCLVLTAAAATVAAAYDSEARRGRGRQQTELLAGSSSLMIGLALKGGC